MAKIEFTQEEKDQLREEIKTFFYEERGEEIGIIVSDKVLEFFMERLGKLIYNKGLDDARVWFSKRMEDVELDFDLLYK